MIRKAQFEAMGLAVVVVLISLGMFILLFFSLRSPTDFVNRYYYEELGQNTIEAVLISNVEPPTGTCQSTFSDLIQDVAVRHTDSCGAPSAELLQAGLDKVLTATLEQKGLRYKFTIVDADNTKYYERGACDITKEQHDTPGMESLPFFPVTIVNVTLYVCSS